MSQSPDVYELMLARPWLRAACDLFGLTVEELRRPNRRPAAVQMRRAVIAVLRFDARLDDAAIGRVLGRDGSTIRSHAGAISDGQVDALAQAIRNRHALNVVHDAQERRMDAIQRRLGRVYAQGVAR